MEKKKKFEQQSLLHFKISFKLISFRYDDDDDAICPGGFLQSAWEKLKSIDRKWNSGWGSGMADWICVWCVCRFTKTKVVWMSIQLLAIKRCWMGDKA